MLLSSIITMVIGAHAGFAESVLKVREVAGAYSGQSTVTSTFPATFPCEVHIRSNLPADDSVEVYLRAGRADFEHIIQLNERNFELAADSTDSLLHVVYIPGTFGDNLFAIPDLKFERRADLSLTSVFDRSSYRGSVVKESGCENLVPL